jgi:dihydroxy-acid dehydratase
MRVDLNKGLVNLLLPQSEIDERKKALAASGGYDFPASQTPWQEIQRGITDQLGDGMSLKPAIKYQKIHQTYGVPRDNH